MAQILARSAMLYAGAATVGPVRPPLMVVDHPVIFHPIIPQPPPPPPVASLPLMGSGSGNLFLDRQNPVLHWYLPDYALAADVDPSFAFVASQAGQQANGQPFNVAKLTLRICKLIPADVAQFSSANPSATLQEIPLADMSAVLSSFYTDQNGQPQQRTFLASGVQDNGDGSCLLTFDGSIIGDSVLTLYQDLRLFGKAVINLTAFYQAWVREGFLLPLSSFRMIAPPMAELNRPPAAPATPPLNMARSANIRFLGRPNGWQPPPRPEFLQLRQTWGKALPLALKYNLDGYQLRYTVSTATVASHVILSAADLSGFNQSQSQFSELKALGDISLKYPSLSRAYFGVLSRTIVVVPQRYSIVRGKSGCSATCLARVDSSAASTSQCCFEFDFTIAPETNPVELQKLQEEISGMADFAGYQMTFADFANDTPPSTLLTTFKSSVQFAAGADAHTFVVTVSVQDDGPNTPAVADANLFILRLISQTGTDLIGSLSLKLDDAFPNAVLATVDLNFSHTVGTDDLLVELDETDNVIKVTNQSPLDLQISDYALVEGANLTEVPGIISLPAGNGVTFPLPASQTNLTFVAAAQLALPASMSLENVTEYLNFRTIDVQQTQYVISVDASGVDFTRVASVTVNITFASLPSLTLQPFQLNSSLQASSLHVTIPLENAVFSLPGTVNLTVQFVSPTPGSIAFTMQNDFTAAPVFSLVQNAIDAHVPSPPPPST